MTREKVVGQEEGDIEIKNCEKIVIHNTNYNIFLFSEFELSKLRLRPQIDLAYQQQSKRRGKNSGRSKRGGNNTENS